MKIRVLESRASNFAETLTNNISNTFKCDIDDVQWDEGSYPEKAKMSFVVYNVSAKTADHIRDKVEQFLSDSGYDIWPGHSVYFEKDFSYVSGSIKSAYRIYFSVKKAAFLESASERFLDYDSAVNYVENQGISLDVAGNDFANMIIDDFEELANEDEEFSTVKLDRFIQWAKQESLKYEDDDDSCTEAKRAQQVRKMFNKNKKRVESFSDGTGTFLNQLKKEIKTAVKKFMMQPHIGFPEGEVDEYSNVKIKLEGEHIEIQVGAELSYEPLEELCTALNKVISKYDHNAYFEPECPGRIVAYLMQYPYLESMHLRRRNIK